MKINDIVLNINQLVGNGPSSILTYDRLKFYIDSVIDQINETCFTSFPNMDDGVQTIDNVIYYNALPGNIIRGVLCYGAAAFYLEEEDELETQYKTYHTRMLAGINQMISGLIPQMKQELTQLKKEMKNLADTDPTYTTKAARIAEINNYIPDKKGSYYITTYGDEFTEEEDKPVNPYNIPF